MAQTSSTLSRDGSTTPADHRVGSPARFAAIAPRRQRLSRIAAHAILGLAVLLLAAAIALLFLRTSYSDRVYPSVLVADVPVGGMSYSDARSAVEQRAAEIESTHVTLTYSSQTWNPTLGELGVSVDTTASLDTAFSVGRELDARDRVGSVIGLARSPKAVPLQLSLDQPTLSTWLDTIDRELGLPAADAYLVVEEGKARIQPNVDGTRVDREAARAIVVGSMRSLAPFVGDLPVEIAPAGVHTEDLQPALAQLDTALSSSIKLTYGKKKWKLTPGDLGEFVIQQGDETGTGAAAVQVSLDRQALSEYLNGLLASEVNRDPKNAQVAWDADKKQVFAAEKSIDGAKLKPLALADAVTSAFFGTEKTVKVPVTKIKPEVDSSNLGALGITTRLAVGDSNFDGSDEGRATNIIVGAGWLNGTLVPPHADFSFNHAIGEITADKGYIESNVIDGERIGKDIGGGICQVSTTVFRAAFFGGFPITEWHPHHYRLGFYELDGYTPGLDASILQPEGAPFSGGDFQFSNPSDSWLLVESYVDGPRVYVIIYGPDLGWDVRISDPWYGPEVPVSKDVEVVDAELEPGTIMQTEYPQEGLDVAYERTVYDRDGNLLWDRTFGSYFYPRGNVYKVSPDMAGKSPAASS